MEDDEHSLGSERASEHLVVVRQLFDRTLDVPDPERETFLAAQTDVPALRSEVLSLVRRHDANNGVSPLTESGGWRPLGPEANGERCPRLSPRDRLGDLRIERLIFLSDSSEVYQATLVDTGEAVAVKLLLAPASDSDAWRRMRVEAEVLSRMQHPGIVTLLDFRKGPPGPVHDLPYLVTPFIDGVPIDKHAHPGHADWRLVATLLAEAADAVHHANLRGVVHRDIKPSNILVRANGRVVVIDFGVARILEDFGSVTAASMRTLGTTIVGTPAYMAPEQFNPRDRDVDLRADVYGLGAVAYFLLVGRPPHELNGLSLGRISSLKESLAPVPLQRLARSRVTAEFSDVIAVALLSRRNDRHESCGEFASELRRVLAGLAPTRRAPGLARRAVLFTRRRPEVVGLVVLATLFAGAGVAGVASQGYQAANQRNIAQRRFDDTRSLGRNLCRPIAARSSTTARVPTSMPCSLGDHPTSIATHAAVGSKPNRPDSGTRRCIGAASRSLTHCLASLRSVSRIEIDDC